MFKVRISALTLLSVLLTVIASTLSAQSAPFAPGPLHPMTAPLDPKDPFARLSPALADAPPIRPTYRNLPVLDNQLVEHDPVNGRTQVLPLPQDGPRFSSMSQPPAQGSIDRIEREPVVGPGVIIGADNRTTISDASSYPWRANAKIYMTFPSGATYVGSCTLVNGKYALTAGHCVYDSGQGGWATSIQVVPGQSGSYLPFGSAWVSYMRTYTGWTTSGNNQHDIALITLDRRIGDTTGFFGYGWWSSLSGVTGNLSAYDADISSTYQKYRSGSITPDTLVIYYTMDTMPGSSGGGVYRIISGSRYVMSVNNWQYSTINMSVRITSSRFSNFQSWIASGT